MSSQLTIRLKSVQKFSKSEGEGIKQPPPLVPSRGTAPGFAPPRSFAPKLTRLHPWPMGFRLPADSPLDEGCTRFRMSQWLQPGLDDRYLRDVFGSNTVYVSFVALLLSFFSRGKRFLCFINKQFWSFFSVECPSAALYNCHFATEPQNLEPRSDGTAVGRAKHRPVTQRRAMMCLMCFTHHVQW